MDRFKDKIKQIRTYLKEVQAIAPNNLEEYKGSLTSIAACERYFEKIVEASVDLARLIIKKKGFDLKDENNVFGLLHEKSIISKELCVRLRDAKAMRNVISHRYGDIDNETVFKSIKEELISDTNSLINSINKIISNAPENLELELKPKYMRKLKGIEKEKGIPFKNIGELRKLTGE